MPGSASSLPRPLDGLDLSALRQLGGFGRLGGRLTSSSPLAGRGRTVEPIGHDRLSSLSLTGNEINDFDILDDLDMNAYLGDEGDMSRADPLNTFGHGPDTDIQGVAEVEERVSSLSQVDRNFLEFLKSRTKSEQATVPAGNAPTTQSFESEKELTFSILLPPESTTRAVATQGLMHVLTLATKGILAVHQDNRDAGNAQEHEANDFYGEIYLRIGEPYL